MLDPQSWNHNPVRKSCDGLKVNALLSLLIALRLKATSYVLAVGLQSTQPDITSYTNKRIYGGNKLGYALNNEFFDNIYRIEQQQIYKEVTLTAYTSNDPIAVRNRLLTEIDMKKQKLKAEIAALRSN